MAQLTNEHDVQFLLMPVNNDRTAWAAYGLPTLIIVPHKRDVQGNDLADGDPWNVRIYVENVPQEARVAGHDHVGLRFPDRELYGINISWTDILDRQIITESQAYVRNGIIIDPEDRVRGDFIRYTCLAGITDDIPYLPDADYYDISDIRLEVELLPSDRYVIVYQANYHTRQTARGGTGELLCIDPSQTSIALLSRPFTHPGEVIEEFYRLTPSVYLTNKNKSADDTVAFYRPFTDLIQDVYDEQNLLERCNWVYDVQSETIPYLSALLGWDLPFFPQSLDGLRRALLRNTARLQTIKGSKKALIELFRLLGLEILITNLWWSNDGKRLIRPTSTETHDPEAVRIEPTQQIEPLLAAYEISGYGSLTIPILHRPQIVSGLDDFSALIDGGDITIDAYLVEIGSAADGVLTDITKGGTNYPIGMLEDPDGFADRYAGITTVDRYGQESGVIQRALTGLEIGGYSQIQLRGKVASEYLTSGWGRPPLTATGVKFDRDDNKLLLAFNGWFNFDGADELPPKRRPSRMYAFATYVRQKLTVPVGMENLQSNRFDVQLLVANQNTAITGTRDYVDPAVLEFAFEYINKIRSFHSILNVLRYTIDLTENYEVTGICLGGDVVQRWDSDFGRIQIPPAKLISLPTTGDCAEFDPIKLGYSYEDLAYRELKQASLQEEFAAYKSLDSRDTPEIYSVTGPRIPARPPEFGRDSCKFTPAGQDRVIGRRVDISTVETSPNPNSNAGQAGGVDILCPVRDVDRGEYDRGATTSTDSDAHAYGSFMLESTQTAEAMCDLDGITDYCYEGRVGDDLLYRPTILAEERYRFSIGLPTMGVGLYWTYPATPSTQIEGTLSPGPKSHTGRPILTGNVTTTAKLGVLDDPVQAEYLRTNREERLSRKRNTLLGRSYRGYGLPPRQSLHYSNRTQIDAIDQSRNLALRRPELGIERAIMHFPGCRFISAGILKTDYVSDYDARPWDDQYSTTCGRKGWCDADPTWLNGRIELNTDGEEIIAFDEVKLTYARTGGDPDIPNFGTHSGSVIPSEDVVHSILTIAPPSHPAIVLFDLVETDVTTINIDTGLFRTAMEIGGTSGGGYVDDSDGYPAETGFRPTVTDLTPRNGITFSSVPSTTLFTFGDGIRTGQIGDRLDAGRDPEELEIYRTQEGDLDWNPDQIILVPSIVLDEPYGVGSIRLDGQIPTMFELIDSSGGTSLDSGKLIYQDYYGQTYVTEWNWSYGHTILDFTVTIEQPYVWGEEKNGHFAGKDLYLRGIVTITRQIFKLVPNGYEILADGSMQFIDDVRTGRHCAPLPTDPFRHHLDNSLSDLIEVVVTMGPRFAEIDDVQAEWGNVDEDGNVVTGPDIIRFIDVWA